MAHLPPERITFLAPPHERREWEDAAESELLTLSAWIRRALSDAASARRPKARR